MAKWQRVAINIPKRFGPTERMAIAQEIIDYIVQRSKSGKDIDGNRFPGYSKEYVKSLNFKIAGKSKGSVDLTLSGEMLDSIKLLSESSGKVLIGFDRGDSELNGKAEGNQLGTYGRSSPDRKKARPFLGISQEDLKKILSRYPKDTEASRTRAEEELAAAAEAGQLVDGVEFDLE